MECGENVVVFCGAYLTYLEKCLFGSNISIHENCNIGCMGGLTVGNDVMISQGVSILTTEHDYMQKGQPIRNASVITAGVTIGDGVVVGAGAVVTHDIAPGTVCGGIPARMIRSR